MVLFYTLHTTKRRRNMKKQGFGTTKDGKEALLYTLSNKNGMEISVTDYGAHLVSVLVPDKDGKKRDVVLGFDSVTGYETDGSHFGATIGRNGNRIAGAAFELHGKTYQLAKNENNNNLHLSLIHICTEKNAGCPSGIPFSGTVCRPGYGK